MSQQDQSNELPREYLGDGVYAEYDGFNITLYLDYGTGGFNYIALEPQVMYRLKAFEKRMINEHG